MSQGICSRDCDGVASDVCGRGRTPLVHVTQVDAASGSTSWFESIEVVLSSSLKEIGIGLTLSLSSVVKQLVLLLSEGDVTVGGLGSDIST